MKPKRVIEPPGDRQLRMLREVLLAATAGKVRLCLDPAELKDPPAGAGPSYDLREETLGEFQRAVSEYAAAQHLPAERCRRLLTAAGAVAMNAVVHGGGEALLATDGHGMVQVRIKECGENAVRATGDGSSPGYDWRLIARSADRVWIYPGDLATVVILEQDRADRHTPLPPAGPGRFTGRPPALPFFYRRPLARPLTREAGGEWDRSDETQEPYAEDLLLLYRCRSGWSQEGLARRLDGVSSRTVRNWEAGVTQPMPQNLARLIEVYLAGGVFLPGQEIDEARRLWQRVKSRFDAQTKRMETYPRFDEAGFALLLGVLGSHLNTDNADQPARLA